MACYQQISSAGVWQRCSRNMASTVDKKDILFARLSRNCVSCSSLRDRSEVNINKSRQFEDWLPNGVNSSWRKVQFSRVTVSYWTFHERWRNSHTLAASLFEELKSGKFARRELAVPRKNLVCSFSGIPANCSCIGVRVIVAWRIFLRVQNNCHSLLPVETLQATKIPASVFSKLCVWSFHVVHSPLFVLLKLATPTILLYRVIHKSVKHFKNSEQMDYATDHGNSYVDRERDCWGFFLRRSPRT